MRSNIKFEQSKKKKKKISLEQKNKMWYVLSMEYYLAFKKIHHSDERRMGLSLENTALS